MLPASLLKYKPLITFSGASLLFIVSQWILFTNYNGADDLHYAMLAAKLTRGEFNPFERGDIFTGRVLLISFQALIYKVFGISVLSTSAGTILATITACYLTVLRFLQQKRTVAVFILCCLFYFSPVVTNAATGIMPDAYVMLVGIILLLILRKSIRTEITPGRKVRFQLLAGMIIALGLLIKETAIVFLPLAVVFYIINSKKKWIANSLLIILSFTATVVVFGLVYYTATGDFFYRIVQIKNSEYANPCNFSDQPYFELLKRLTYSVWQRFIITGYYPVILGFITSVAIFIERRKATSTVSLNNSLYFISLLIIALYFPFSLKGYNPLCDDPRHFLFLIPFAVIAFSDFINREQFTKSNQRILITGLLLVLIVCITSTLSKWQWMIYTLLLLTSLVLFFYKKSVKPALYFLSVVLVVSISERLYLPHNNWFSQMKKVNAVTQSDCYYFTNRDLMMHWKLLNEFKDDNIQYYNLDRNPSRISKLYNKDAYKAPFHTGWLIVVKSHHSTPKELISRINSSSCCQYFSQKIEQKDLFAIYLTTHEQLEYVKSLMK